MSGQRIVFATFGSFGDVHPYLALALELKARGHSPVIATNEQYREKTDAAGVELHPLPPDDLPSFDEPEKLSALIEKAIDARTGVNEIIDRYILPHLRETYQRLASATRNADLLVTHPLTFIGRVVAEKYGVPWASSVLAPISLFSTYDPPVPPQLPMLHRLFTLHPVFFHAAMAAGRWQTRKLTRAVNRIRADEGLPPAVRNPLFEGQHSPALVLALFSQALAQPQLDHPPNTFITGFPFYDRRDYFGEIATPRLLLDFLDAGEPPIVFTLGSSAFWVAKDFYTESVKAAQSLGRRALLLIGHARNRPAELPASIAAFEYAPFGEVLPRAAAIVHQGGVGTMGQSLRAGRPQLIVPFSHDQFDNAERVARLGAGRVLPRPKYHAASAARELRLLLGDASYVQRASEAGRVVRSEDGTRTACDLIEERMLGLQRGAGERPSEDRAVSV